MDLRRYVTDQPPPGGNSRASWERRFEEIIGQGLAGEWINATEAWGTKPNGRQAAMRSAERCGITIDWRAAKGPAGQGLTGW